MVAPAAEAARIAHVDETVRRGRQGQGRRRSRRASSRRPATPPGHISYFFPADKLAFVGDTLFSIGCGRVIEGNAEMMWQSLLKLRALPDDTRFYCGHEYTDANIRFAKTVEPNNAALAGARGRGEAAARRRQATIPATIGAEKAANPFLRADDPEVAKSLGLAGSPAWKVFAEIRERKNKS